MLTLLLIFFKLILLISTFYDKKIGKLFCRNFSFDKNCLCQKRATFLQRISYKLKKYCGPHKRNRLKEVKKIRYIKIQPFNEFNQQWE